MEEKGFTIAQVVLLIVWLMGLAGWHFLNKVAEFNEKRLAGETSYVTGTLRQQ